MKKTCFLMVGVLFLSILFIGCAANLQTATAPYTVNGETHVAVFMEGRGVHGATLSSINCYDKTGKLETNNSFGTAGILSSFVQGGLAGAEMGAGIGAGLAAQGASQVIQSGGGGGGAQSTAGASQAQAQRQRQTQGQGQAQGNVNTFTPANTNVNTNLNTLKQGQSTGPLSPINVH